MGPSCPSSSFLCLGGAAPLLVQATTLKVFLLNQCGTTSNFCQTSTRLPCTSTGRGLGGARWGPPDSGQTAREGGLWEWEGHLGKVKAAKVGLGGSAWEEPCHCRILTMGGSLNCFHLLSALQMLILTSFCDFLLQCSICDNSTMRLDCFHPQILKLHKEKCALMKSNLVSSAVA